MNEITPEQLIAVMRRQVDELSFALAIAQARIDHLTAPTAPAPALDLGTGETVTQDGWDL
jgi:hypothetical protein